MLYRKIEKYIENQLLTDSQRILLVEGARQVGKSYIIRSVGKRLFKNYIEVNMETDKLGERLFAEARTVDDFYLALSSVAGNRMGERESTLIFIDEIQAYDHLLTLLKFLKTDNRFTYIASGSLLGITLKTTQSLPIGSVEIIRMYPLDFEEFLIANGVGALLLDTMRSNFEAKKSMPPAIHEKLMDLFKKYLIVGGLPAAVCAFVDEQNVMKVRSIQRDVMRLYQADAARYEESSRRLRIQRIYELIPSNLENKKKRIVAKDVEHKAGKRMTDYCEEFDYLTASGIALEVKAVSNPKFPLVESAGKNLLKLYLNDVGLLTYVFFGNNVRAVLDDVKSVNLGSVYETAVAQEFSAHGFRLYYYDNKKNGEVDYLIDDTRNLSVLPIEVKSGKDYKVHSALSRFLAVEDYHVSRAIVLSNAREVEEKDGIVYMPVYYVVCLSPA